MVRTPSPLSELAPTPAPNALPRHVYVHVPFCRRRCTYCDFAIAVRRSVPVADFIDSLAREIDLRYPDRAPRAIDTLYFGGGTPSLLGGDGVARLLDRLRARFAFDDGAELTLEANPDDVSAESARAWRAAGINRLSIGAQSFDARVLVWMHRSHDAAQIARAVWAARAAGIENLSLDLIFALPSSLDRDWRDDLRRALELEPAHLSLYGLTIEPATPLARWRDRQLMHEAPDDMYERDFLLADETLGAAGFEHYEVSNYARPGRRARHNSSYWRHLAYDGFGPSAHSFDTVRRRWNARELAAWSRLIAAGGDPVEDHEVLTADNRNTERIYLGLRTNHGVEIAPPALAADDAMLDRWVAAGWAMREGSRLRLTPRGWLRLDTLATDLTALSSHS
ncbi:MAG TPA: radical SAM family heme chaperone HemW [Gemmatimonadaceae bacterium]|nr:radical SAM family heme chaperone HemW [Gemmatimonadaceae bacterium]